MTRTTFPNLPDDVMAGGGSDFQRLEHLSQHPDQWETISEVELTQLFNHAMLIYGMTQDAERMEPLGALYAVALNRLSAADRLRVFSSVSVWAEQRARKTSSGGCALPLFPFMALDDDYQIVSSAALSIGELWGADSDDDWCGRATVFSHAMGITDHTRRCSMLAGLVALGDEPTLAQISRTDLNLPRQERMALLGHASPFPYVAVAEFLLRWAEDAVNEDEEEMAAALGALGHLAKVATGDKSNIYAGRGICELQRRYPAWAYPQDEVISWGRSWSVAEFGAEIRPRLELLASREQQEPKIAMGLMKVFV